MKIPTPEQARQLLGAIRPNEPFGARDFALIVLDLHTGLRAAELCGQRGQPARSPGVARSPGGHRKRRGGSPNPFE